MAVGCGGGVINTGSKAGGELDPLGFSDRRNATHIGAEGAMTAPGKIPGSVLLATGIGDQGVNDAGVRLFVICHLDFVIYRPG